MSKDNQIEEMAKDMCALPIDCAICSRHEYVCKAKRYAQRAIDKGYRKASEVAREICENIIEYAYTDSNGDFAVPVAMVEMIEKKYTEGEG